ncbi:hypothetical protein [Sphaerothrix gracilis]|uniref:hypothetical protein n=1 Tax=Sphaerothrix gracilis TaxID=3151835 RepID=UPI0031FCA878
MEGARPDGSAPVELHHHRGHDRRPWRSATVGQKPRCGLSPHGLQFTAYRQTTNSSPRNV